MDVTGVHPVRTGIYQWDFWALPAGVTDLRHRLSAMPSTGLAIHSIGNPLDWQSTFGLTGYQLRSMHSSPRC